MAPRGRKESQSMLMPDKALQSSAHTEQTHGPRRSKRIAALPRKESPPIKRKAEKEQQVRDHPKKRTKTKGAGNSKTLHSRIQKKDTVKQPKTRTRGESRKARRASKLSQNQPQRPLQTTPETRPAIGRPFNRAMRASQPLPPGGPTGWRPPPLA